MTREEIITALDVHANGDGKCTGCPIGDDTQCTVTLARDALVLLKAQEPIEARLHLCESCAKEYPECDATIDGMEFGCGVGNDNIIGCTAYVNRWKAQEPRVMTLEEIPYAVFGWMEIFGQLIPCVLEDVYDDDTVGFANIEDGHDYMCASDYGKTWRVWTSEPTEEQRRATQWN